MANSDEPTETNVDRTRHTSGKLKRQSAIEGWSVGILGTIALLGTIHLSLHYGW